MTATLTCTSLAATLATLSASTTLSSSLATALTTLATALATLAAALATLATALATLATALTTLPSALTTLSAATTLTTLSSGTAFTPRPKLSARWFGDPAGRTLPSIETVGTRVTVHVRKGDRVLMRLRFAHSWRAGVVVNL